MDTQAIAKLQDKEQLYPSQQQTATIMTWAERAAQAKLSAVSDMDVNTVAMVALKGFSMGMDLIDSLDSIYVIHGRTMMSSELIRRRLLQLGGDYRLIEEDGDHCTVEILRPGDEPGDGHTETFTMKDAKRANLLKSGGNWAKYPRQMLRARAISNGVRWYFPQVLAGSMAENEEADIQQEEAEKPRPRVTEAAEEPAADENLGWSQKSDEEAQPLGEDFAQDAKTALNAAVQTADPDGDTIATLTSSFKNWKINTFGTRHVADIDEAEAARNGIDARETIMNYVRDVGQKLGLELREGQWVKPGEEAAQEDAQAAEEEIIDVEPQEAPEEQPEPESTHEWHVRDMVAFAEEVMASDGAGGDHGQQVSIKALHKAARQEYGDGGDFSVEMLDAALGELDWGRDRDWVYTNPEGDDAAEQRADEVAQEADESEGSGFTATADDCRQLLQSLSLNHEEGTKLYQKAGFDGPQNLDTLNAEERTRLYKVAVQEQDRREAYGQEIDFDGPSTEGTTERLNV